MFSGSMTALAASDGIAKGYTVIWCALDPEQEEVMELPEYIEYVETETDPQIKIKEGEVSVTSTEGLSLISWSVDSKTLMQTLPFSASKGGSIVVAVSVRPADKEVKVGIIMPDGSRRYVQVAGGIYYEFELDVSGEYQVFVENTSGVTVQVDGYYTVY